MPVQPGLVTIAIPSFNGSRFLGDALASAARQTHDPIEILVVDDASDDGSADLAEDFSRRHADRRMRVVRNAARLGLAGNWNRCLELADGEFVKFLFQDDLLEPECVAELVRGITRSPTAAMAFSPRTLRVDGPGGWMTRRWIARNRVLHSRFTRLEEMNDGRRLFREQMARDPFRNWIGEPTAVLLRTTVARQAGGFNPRLKQLVDAELWLRLMCRGDVAFVNKHLATFTVHAESATARHVSDGAAWLDPWRMLDGLLADSCVREQGLRVQRLRWRAITRVIRGEFVRLLKGHVPAVFGRVDKLRGRSAR